MTHSNHRRGDRDNLAHDYVVLSLPGRRFDDLPGTVEQFKSICRRHGPVNPDRLSGGALSHFVYDSKEKVIEVLRNLIEADLGLSVVVSGLFEEVKGCCQAAGTYPHTVNHSLGFWGEQDKLPHQRMLEFTTMCGHGQVSPNLVYHLAKKVQGKAMSTADAALEMTKPCLCNIFNPVRAEELLHRFLADLGSGTLSEADLSLPVPK